MMNRRSTKRLLAGAAAVGLAVAALSGCSASTGDSGDGKVTLTWWHNGNQDPLKGLWEDVAAEFEEANPNVTVEVTGYQNEDLQKTLIPNALRSNDPPDLFQAWGGGELKDQVAAGYVKDISDDVKDELDAIGPTVSGWQIDGATYALPFSYGIEGFWYNKDLFAQAGITAPPTTLDELNDDVAKLKDAGIAPISVGAGDKWPAAHWWYNFALKDCSPETLTKAQSTHDFSDSCFTTAGEDLETFLKTEPFNEGFLATPAQQGAGSSAGLLASGKVAMELMGHWEPGVIGGLTDDKKVPEFLGWFNFPGIDGAAGDPTAALGGGDGFACSQQAPPECVDLLKYIMSADVQKRFGESGAGIPTVADAASSVADPNLQMVLEGKQNASYVQLWLDTAYGATVGGAMNDGIVNLFAGKGSAEDIVKGMQDAAATE
ncbi:extracellular solute-binding protein [Leifsonia sp. YIM 134122]|uniref:Extracellular solute-binding protein n=1 Tax=Leifsonia stereocauli TaxID=3134136 RepID=A0ABU9W6D6_9MICO